MGGCATKPKKPHGHLPDEDPSAPELVAKSVDIPAAAPATAAEVKEAGDGGNAGNETGGDAPADGSEPKAEHKADAAAVVTGGEAGAQDGSEKAKLELPNPDAAEAPKDAAEGATTPKEAAAAAAVADAYAGEATEEAKKPQEAKTWVEEVSHKEGTAAANDSSSA
ncbi:hypothetical protein Taro_028153 [Colocasia esculenta]|uniref:Uncharacterized protein n=1 Tax=Colocasia esculenta TaxID=4460 RepID=A0A843VTD3_COLES|nr:hypothetical protein [Colocasia esculenta]